MCVHLTQTRYVVFHGTVTAISEATGSKYSLVPTDNSAGMAIAYPIVPKVLDALSSKFLLLTDLSIQFLLSWVCARSQNIDLVIICSFFIGFLKGFLMLWFIRRAGSSFLQPEAQQIHGGGKEYWSSWR